MRHGVTAVIAALLAILVVGTGASARDGDGDGLRDGFERRYGLTDAALGDTDGDGVPDSAEDHDLDGLSNLGEQRFRTDPRRRDSDRDGVPDSGEDANGDGRSNARDQDRRPLPGRLTPSLSAAPTAFPPGRAECQTEHGEATIHPCAFGDIESDYTVVVFGDSHATQWLPALARAGRWEGWKVVLLTKTACPSVSVTTPGQLALDRNASCGGWRSRALRWLRAEAPDVVVISNLGFYQVSDASWRRGLATTLAALAPTTMPIVIADTPRLRNEPVACLRANPRDISACVTDRASAFNPSHERMERAAARASGAGFISLGWKVCAYDPCPLVVGTTMIWRDHGHITATFSRQLAPAMRSKLMAAIERPEQGRDELISGSERVSRATSDGDAPPAMPVSPDAGGPRVARQ